MLPLEFRKYFHSIFVIYFFKYFIGKIHPVDAPSPLPVMAWVCVYIFVIRLQKPEINPVGIMPWRCVGTKKDPILIFDHELSARSEEHTSELQSRGHLVCRRLLEKTINCI